MQVIAQVNPHPEAPHSAARWPLHPRQGLYASWSMESPGTLCGAWRARVLSRPSTNTNTKPYLAAVRSPNPTLLPSVAQTLVTPVSRQNRTRSGARTGSRGRAGEGTGERAASRAREAPLTARRGGADGRRAGGGATTTNGGVPPWSRHGRGQVGAVDGIPVLSASEEERERTTRGRARPPRARRGARRSGTGHSDRSLHRDDRDARRKCEPASRPGFTAARSVRGAAGGCRRRHHHGDCRGDDAPGRGGHARRGGPRGGRAVAHL